MKQILYIILLMILAVSVSATGFNLCTTDDDCNYLNSESCNGNLVTSVKGECKDSICKTVETTVEDCSAKVAYMNDCGKWEWSCSEELNIVHCVITGVVADDSNCDAYCDGDYLYGGMCNPFTLYCDYGNMDCNELNNQYCDGSSIKYDDYTCLGNSCVVDSTDVTECDNGLFCDGQETCNAGQCVNGNPVDCSYNDLEEIATCLYSPDDNPYTWDYFEGFVSSCDEVNDICTTGVVNLTHTISSTFCEAKCDNETMCDDYCEGNILFFSGECNEGDCLYEDLDCASQNYCEDNYYCEGDVYMFGEVCHDFTCSDSACNEEIYETGAIVENCSSRNSIINECGRETWTCGNDCELLSDYPDDTLCDGICDPNTFYCIDLPNETLSVVLHSDPFSGVAPLGDNFVAEVFDSYGDVTYSWNFGDGNSKNGSRKEFHMFEDPGNYLVKVIVSDQFGVASDSQLINVHAEKVSEKPKYSLSMNMLSIMNNEPITPGDDLLLSVSFENQGKSKLDNLKVMVSIPELSIFRTIANIDVKPGKTASSMFYLPMPEDTKPGMYNVRIAVSNDEVRRIKYREFLIG